MIANLTMPASCAQNRKLAEFMVYSSDNSAAIYGLAQHRRGLTGLNLLQILETRLDNVVYRLGFAVNRAQARQLVNHGHFQVNGTSKRYSIDASQTW